MDNQVPELMWQPDIQLHFLKQNLKRDFKNDKEIEEYLATADLPREQKVFVESLLNRVKKLRKDNQDILDKETHDKPKDVKEKIR